MKYEFIEANRQDHCVMVMCRVLQVSRSGYYAWIERPVSLTAQDNERLVVLIRASHAASGGIYGAPRVTADLREAGERCGKNRVARLMRIHEIRGVTGCKRPRPLFGRPSLLMPNPIATSVHCRRTEPGVGHRHHLYPNLARLVVSCGRH